ncbi:MAG: chorismate-binding protein, partial [Phycisphaerales bacterium]|nr:chorismate-binding protein [Phycisphaerales bacterium]
MPSINQAGFVHAVERARNESHPHESHPHEAHRVVVPVAIRVLADQLTPVLAYRRLVSSDQRTAPSFLLESVEGGDQQGRYSILAAHPKLELTAKDSQLTITDHQSGESTTTTEPDPLDALRKLSEHWVQRIPKESADQDLLPKCVLGGWFGYAGYDSVRYAEPTKLSINKAPHDDRNLPDLSFGFYDELVIFDHVDKLIYLVKLVFVAPNDDPVGQYNAAINSLDALAIKVQEHSKPLPLGRVESTPLTKNTPMPCNTTRQEHAAMIERAKEYIQAGDIFQVVLGHRFERRANADPFDVYRTLRAVNPSPYMVYMQTRGSILVASSPEILCRVRR